MVYTFLERKTIPRTFLDRLNSTKLNFIDERIKTTTAFSKLFFDEKVEIRSPESSDSTASEPVSSLLRYHNEHLALWLNNAVCDATE